MQFKTMNSNDIYEALKEDILTLKIVPGQLLSENGISQIYNVSRTPVKTAFLRLMSEKFIEIVPQKGTYVTLLDLAFIKEIIYMRQVLETDMLKNIIDNTNEELFEKMRLNLKAQERLLSLETFEPKDFYKTDSAFHQILFEFAGRPRIWGIIQEFQVYYTRFRMLDIVATKHFKQLYSEHCQLLEILIQKDYEQLEKLISKHLHGNLNRLADKISNEYKDYFL